MIDRLLSLGLDVGTTSSQMVFSELLIEDRAGRFSVPEMEISQRKILYRSPVHFTPLLGEDRVDAAALRQIVDREYAQAGIRREDVDTGAIIITGETSRKENARAVLTELSGYAGDFVVAAAGPDLESVLAARGAGATDWSARTGNRVLHMDIGGGTSNLSLIEDGNITATGCLNVGGRLVKLDERGRITYMSPVLEGLCSLKVGDAAPKEELEVVAQLLTEALEMAAGLRVTSPLLHRLMTAGTNWKPPKEPATISFSGGVADCIETETPWLAYGDMGPTLGQAIRRSLLCRGNYRLGSETIRATVIGAGCHSAQLSGSTVFHQGVTFPLKNLPVVRLTEEEQAASDLPSLLRQRLSRWEEPAVIAMPGFAAPEYARIIRLAEAILEGIPAGPVMLCLEADMAKALGQALAVRLPEQRPILCIDRVKLGPESYLDVAAPVGTALPVVVKTLILNQ